ncbi:DNA-binding protein [Marinobacterium sedimentorum]|uniref:DNA-binding protein n=1 Tax=Marinobacterium sedimentorum TaxID=2927804 RepID=UPI0020C63195|nr:DNA-binding protein [Marinobacterium sedimentorum]MCP8686077.1 DNA-binding protein [Marinobacterium sedimentorum]
MEQQPMTPVATPTPPLMAWREFADWIRMEQSIVRGWIEKGLLPTERIGKHRLVNVSLLSKQLLERDSL